MPTQPIPQSTPHPAQPSTHISVILDRSGSMESIRADVIGGFNAFLARQQQEPGQATLSLVQFDSQDPYEVLLHFVPLAQVSPLSPERYMPRAMTPLLDALGRGIADLDATLAAMPVSQRPSQIVVVVVTDGLENASRQFTHTRVRALIAAHEAQGWQFVFLSADLAALDEAEAIGFAAQRSLAFDPDPQGTNSMWDSVSQSTSNYRRGRSGDMFFREVDRQRREQQRRQRSSAQPGKEAALMTGSDQLHMELNASNLSSRQVLDALFDQGLIALERSALFDTAPQPLPASVGWERMAGMLLGLAVGDSLGNTSEGLLPHTRRQLYGEVRDYLPNVHAGHRRVGVPSDDTQLAFWTLEQLLIDGRLLPDHLAQAFGRRRIYGIGNTIRDFLASVMDRNLPWYQAGVASAGNGALMRIAPVLLPYVRKPSVELWADAALAAIVTHNDAASTSACVAWVGMLWELLGMTQPPAPEWWVERYVALARPLEGDGTQYRPRCPMTRYPGYRGPLWRFVEEKVLDVWQHQVPVLAACNGWCSGAYLLETLPCVLYILMRCAHDPEEAIVRAVNDTKDNDSVAALVGTAVGALYGVEALPVRWRKHLLGRTTADDDGRIFALLDAAQVRWWLAPGNGS